MQKAELLAGIRQVAQYIADNAEAPDSISEAALKQALSHLTSAGVALELPPPSDPAAFTVGQRVRLRMPVEFSDGGAVAAFDIKLPKGAEGIVIGLGDDLNPVVVVRFDTTFYCLAESENCAQFDQEADGCHGIAYASDVLEAC